MDHPELEENKWGDLIIENEELTMTPAVVFNDHNYDSDNELQEVEPTNDEHLDAEDNTEPPLASVQPGESDLDQPVAMKINSAATCEGLRLKAGQLV